MSQVELARAANLTQPTLSALELGASHRTGKTAQLAAVLGLSALWLETGTGPMQPQNESELLAFSSEAMMASITLIEVKGCCGNQHIPAEPYDYSPISLSVRLLKRLGANPSNLIGLYGDGDSMWPSLHNGDILFFDRTVNAIRDGGVFLLETPDGLRVKRVLRRMDGQVTLRCDNPDRARFPDVCYSKVGAEQIVVKGQFCLKVG